MILKETQMKIIVLLLLLSTPAAAQQSVVTPPTPPAEERPENARAKMMMERVKAEGALPQPKGLKPAAAPK